jgi:hypothetical protein
MEMVNKDADSTALLSYVGGNSSWRLLEEVGRIFFFFSVYCF